MPLLQEVHMRKLSNANSKRVILYFFIKLSVVITKMQQPEICNIFCRHSEHSFFGENSSPKTCTGNCLLFSALRIALTNENCAIFAVELRKLECRASAEIIRGEVNLYTAASTLKVSICSTRKAFLALPSSRTEGLGLEP